MRKILVADDEKVVRDVISRFLRLKDYDVFTAENGREAVKKVTDDHFDLLIMDLRMPGLRAQEILQAIRETKKDLPVIILTGTIDAEESEILQKFGHPVEDIISKPADLFEILEKIKEKLPDN